MASEPSCPVCSPTRASILTGRYPQRTGVTDFIGAAQPAKWTRNTRHLPARYAEALPLAERTLAEILHEHGYATFFGGKWHLGGMGTMPEDQGFDINLAGSHHGGPWHGGKYFSPYGISSLPDGPPGEHLCERMAAEAAKFIDSHSAKPFLVYLPFYSVHVPLMTRPELEKKYEAKCESLASRDRFGSEPPITSPDLLPTILDAAGLPAPANLDGASVLGAVAAAAAPAARESRPLFWHYPHYGNQGGAPSAVIRDGDWKLIEWFDDGRTELFNLRADPGETTNLAEREPERVATLSGRLHDWQRDVGAIRTTPNPRFDSAGPDGRK